MKVVKKPIESLLVISASFHHEFQVMDRKFDNDKMLK